MLSSWVLDKLLKGLMAIESVSEDRPYQLSNLWEFQIGSNDSMVFDMVSVSLPFEKLTHQTRQTGEKPYTGVEFVDTVSITIREQITWGVYQYFKEWMDAVYDSDTREFISLPESVEKGSENDPIHRDGVLSFKSFRTTGELKDIEFITREFVRGVTAVAGPSGLNSEDLVGPLTGAFTRQIEYARRFDQTLVRKEILQSIFRSVVDQTTAKVGRFARNAQRTASNVSGGLVPPPAGPGPEIEAPPTKLSAERVARFYEFNSQAVRLADLERKFTPLVQRNGAFSGGDDDNTTLRIQKQEEYQTKAFSFRNMKILGIDPITSDYAGGDPIEYTINFSVEEVEPLEG